MKCRFVRMIYPQKGKATDSGFMVGLYAATPPVKLQDGSILYDFKAVGYMLPDRSQITYDLQGVWEKNAKYGEMQFKVESYAEVIGSGRRRLT